MIDLGDQDFILICVLSAVRGEQEIQAAVVVVIAPRHGAVIHSRQESVGVQEKEPSPLL